MPGSTSGPTNRSLRAGAAYHYVQTREPRRPRIRDIDGVEPWLKAVGYELRPETMLPSAWVFEAGESNPWHRQREQEELYLVLDGRFEVAVKGETFDAGPGEVASSRRSPGASSPPSRRAPCSWSARRTRRRSRSARARPGPVPLTNDDTAGRLLPSSGRVPNVARSMLDSFTGRTVRSERNSGYCSRLFGW